jgi:hypothetical protein
VTDPVVPLLVVLATMCVLGWAAAFHTVGLLAREREQVRTAFRRLQTLYWRTLAPGQAVIDYNAVKDQVGYTMNDLLGGDEKR